MKTRRLTTALLTGLLFVPLASADDEFDALQREFDEAQREWYQELEKYRGEDGIYRYNADDMPPNPTDVFLPRFRAYAEKHAGTPAALPALVWIINETRPSFSATGENTETPGKWAVDQIRKDHAGDAAIKAHLPRLRYAGYRVGSKPLMALYERVLEVNKDKDARAWATFNLGYSCYEGSPGWRPGEKVDADKERALELFRRAVKDYGGAKAAEYAAGYIYEIEHLQIGMKAPEIVGTDADGKEIKLSQFRGQVVVLDFWGFW
ncbi:MAG: peroxiredoxin family protein [Phycisphaerae bacterium]